MGRSGECTRMKRLAGLLEGDVEKGIANVSFGMGPDDVERIIHVWESDGVDGEELDGLREEVVEFLGRDFSVGSDGVIAGMENFPDSITLFRLVSASEGAVDEKKMGIHWTPDRDRFLDEGFLGSIGIEFESTDELRVIEGVFYREQIDPVETTIHRFSFPEECEVTVYPGQSPSRYRITAL